jgi:nitrous oxidase accessory protein NosD
MRCFAIGLYLLALACAPRLPDAADCRGEVLVASTASELEQRLAEATPGDCVVARGGSYAGHFVVQAGVQLVGERAAEVLLHERIAETSVLALAGTNSQAIGVTVQQSSGHGVTITAPGVRVAQLEISDCSLAALSIRCEDAGCFTDTGPIQLNEVRASRSGVGLWIGAGQVQVTSSHFVANTQQSLTGGVGVYVVNGASLTLQDTAIDDNRLGLVADGEETRVLLQDCSVAGNSERGVWGQGLRGDVQQRTSLQIEGSGSHLRGNGLCGVCALDSTGIALRDVSITDTVAVPVLIDDSQTTQIGDGISLLGATADVLVDAVTLDNNARAQALIDSAGANIVFTAHNEVLAGPGQYKVVVQNSTTVVEVPAGDLSTADELAVSAQSLQLPAFE